MKKLFVIITTGILLLLNSPLVFPEEHVEKYLKYFGVSESKFFENIDKWANKELFEKGNSGWKPKYKIV